MTGKTGELVGQRSGEQRALVSEQPSFVLFLQYYVYILIYNKNVNGR